jgi:hypothetical protein
MLTMGPRKKNKKPVIAAPIMKPLSSLQLERDLRAKQDQELDVLRQRGLAKILNKHFTETTLKLATEKAAVDAALRDLDRRKQQTSEFIPSHDHELSQLDKLYVSANQWKSECRRKEKETLLLYQRYVDKFASAGYVQVPGCLPLTPPRKNNSAANKTTPATGSTTAGSPWTPDVASPPPPSSPPAVTHLAASIESTLEDYLKAGGISLLPSIGQLGVNTTFASEHDKEIQDFRNYYRQQQQQQMQQQATTSNDSSSPARNEQDHPPSAAAVEPTPRPTMTQLASTPEGDEREPETPAKKDKRSPAISFLQTIEDVASQGGDVKENSDAAAKDDKKGANDDKKEEEADEEEDCFVGPINYLQRGDSDSDSVVSGLTVNTVATRRFIDDCACTVATFLNTEQEFIRQQMALEEELTNHASSSSFSHHMDAEGSTSEVQSVQQQAAIQAEHMARQMKEILEKYERDQASATDTSGSLTQSDDPKEEQQPESRPYPTNNPNEDWMVLFDTTYQREYYHELKSGRTQWESPMVADDDFEDMTGDATSTTSRASPTMILSDAVSVKTEVQRGGESRPASRMDLYRRQMRRQRKRQRRALAAIALLVLTAVVAAAWVYTHPESAVAKRYVEPWRQSMKAAELLRLEEERAKEEADRLQVLEEERLALELRQRLAREAAEQKALEEAERKAKEEAERKARIEAERQARIQAEQAKRIAEQEAKDEAKLWIQRQEQLKRPVGCNIPFAYVVHGKCRRLASENPVYDLHDLVASMLQ